MNLKNKITIVTGASTGIGRAICIDLSKQGAIVYLVARREDKLKETYTLINNAGGKAEIVVGDLSTVSSVNSLIDEIKRKNLEINILVNVAGIWHGKNKVYADIDFDKFSQEVILNTINVGIIAPILLSHAFIPLMDGGGKIINISGTFENGAKGWLPYYVSKKSIEDLTIGLSQELSDKNIQVNCVSPSDTATEEYKKYFPQYIDEAVLPEDIAKVVIEFCKSDTTGEIRVVKKS